MISIKTELIRCRHSKLLWVIETIWAVFGSKKTVFGVNFRELETHHSIVEAEAQISAVSGRIIKQKVTFIGKEKLNINGKEYNTLHFNFSSTDKSLKKDKKLNTDVWYDEKNLNWVKASFKKKGDWEYKMISID